MHAEHGTIQLLNTQGLDFAQGQENHSSSLDFTADKASIQASLASIRYTSLGEYHGPDTLSIEIKDEGDLGFVNGESFQRQVDIQVLQVNDAPIIDHVLSYHGYEDLSFALTGIQVQDPDASLEANHELLLTLSVGQGELHIEHEGQSLQASTVTLQGSESEINASLQGLVYQGNSQFHGQDELHILINDQAYGAGLGEEKGQEAPLAQESIALIPIHVRSINDAPLISHSQSFTLHEDVKTALPSILLSDVEASQESSALLDLDLQVSSGNLFAELQGSAQIIQGDLESSHLTLRGNLEDLQNTLNTLEYQGFANYYGSDSLHMQVHDLGYEGAVLDEHGQEESSSLLSMSSQMSLDILPVNDLPSVLIEQKLPGDSFHVLEEESLQLPLEISEEDSSFEEDQILKATVKVHEGSLSLGNNAGLVLVDLSSQEEKGFEIQGSLVQLNQALQTLSYEGREHFHGMDELSILIEENSTSSQETIEHRFSYTLDVIPVNDMPSILIDSSSESILEDERLQFQGLEIADPDVEMNSQILLEINLEVSQGSLYISSENLEGHEIQIQGTVEEINSLLSELEYQADPHFHGQDRLEIYLNDLGNISPLNPDGTAQETLDTSAFVDIEIIAQNDAPFLLSQEELQAQEEIWSPLEALLVQDADTTVVASFDMQLDLSVDHGSLRVNPLNSIGSSSLTLSGDLASIQNQLHELQYLSHIDYHGIDHLSFTLSDLSGISANPTDPALIHTGQFVLDVSPVNDQAILTVPQAVQETEEDTPLMIQGLSFTDTDTLLEEGLVYIVDLYTDHGLLELPLLEERPVELLAHDQGVKTLQLEGTQEDLNHVLSQILYTPDLHYHDDDKLYFKVNDQGMVKASIGIQEEQAFEEIREIPLEIHAVNDMPQWHTPQGLFTAEDHPLWIQGLSISDPDTLRDPQMPVQVTLQAQFGSIDLREDFSGNTDILTQSASPVFSAQGSIVQVQDLLENLVYTAHENAYGMESIQLTLDDLGNVSAADSSALSLVHTSTLNIAVLPVNDAPVWNGPESIELTEDESLNLSSFSIFDADISLSAQSLLELELHSQHTLMSFTESQGLHFIQGDGLSDKHIHVQGTQENLQAALDSLLLLAELDYYGSDEISYRLSDLGNVSAQSQGLWTSYLSQVDSSHALFSDLSQTDAKEISGDISLDILAINDLPTMTLPGPQVIQEDQLLSITGLAIDDVDALHSPQMQIQVTLDVHEGSLSFSSLETGVQLSSFTENNRLHYRLEGDIEKVQASLAQFEYLPKPHYHGQDTVTVQVSDLGGVGEIRPYVEGQISLEIQDQEAVSVQAINDPPEISMANSYSMMEDEVLEIRDLMVSDPDLDLSPQMQMRVSLAVDHGLLSLELASLWQDPDFELEVFGGYGYLEPSFEIQGSVESLNLALQTLSYKGSPHFFGEDALQVEVNDLGNFGQILETGQEGPLSTEQSSSIFVHAVNDAPQVQIQNYSTLEDTPLQLSSILLEDVELSSTHSQEHARVELSLHIPSERIPGTLELRDIDLELFENVSFSELVQSSEGSHIQGLQLSLEGRLEDLQEALNQLYYMPASNYHGEFVLEIRFDDMGNFGPQGALFEEKQIVVTVHSVNDAPDALDLSTDHETGLLVSGYTVIAELLTSDVDLLTDDSPVESHQYSILSQPSHEVLVGEEPAYIIQNNQLLIANIALLSFDETHLQNLQIQSRDYRGEQITQDFIISDRPSQEILEGKLFVNTDIAEAASELKGILGIEFWSSENFSPSQEGNSSSSSSDSNGESSQGTSDAVDALENAQMEDSEEETSNPFSSYDFLSRMLQ